MSSFDTSREIPATPDQVFAAFSDPARLARWWGPAGFTNSFELCEFKVGGRWKFVMHGPNGEDYKNESVFEEIVPPSRVVFHHVSGPKYRMVITLAPTAKGTLVTWSQTFESAEVAERIEKIVGPANEENLDRWTAEVMRVTGGG